MNIESQLDALKLKDIESLFYEKVFENEKVIPKVTPFSGINTDLLYLKDNKLLFIKFMDTSEDLFSILEEEILEVMYEEYLLLKKKMKNTNIEYNYIFVMPNIEIEENYDFDDFIKNNIIDKNRVLDILDNKEILNSYFEKDNNEINLNLFLLSICPEYFVLNSTLHINKDFKKISFYNDEYEYSAVMLDKEQLEVVNSINYEETVFEGGYATGKTSLMFSKCVKLSKIYPHHKF
ncbi:MAG: DNA helicase, partial [Peptostreptococcaceae bacterium]